MHNLPSVTRRPPGQAAQKTPDGCFFSLAHASVALPEGNQGPDPHRGPSWHSMERSSKMEFFQKLGYSQEDVVRVLGKLGEGALVNDVLQELIQTGSRPGAHEGSAVPLLVPRGSCATLDSAQRGPAAELEEDYGGPASSLRPIVIDGSNVAMRYFSSPCSLGLGDLSLFSVVSSKESWG